jgi:GNAT superfamily N-acetyltransferase
VGVGDWPGGWTWCGWSRSPVGEDLEDPRHSEDDRLPIVRPADLPLDLDVVRALFREYADELGVDLGFQGFEQELQDLPGDYAPPRGTLILACHEDAILGCVAVRPIDAETAEMKRLYLRRQGRATGLGRRLALAAIDHARLAGYRRIRLDTLPQMRRAQELYHSLGFYPIPPYRYNPVSGTTYLELALSA